MCSASSEGGCHEIDLRSQAAVIQGRSSGLGPGTDRFHSPVPNQVLQCGQWDADVTTDADEANSTLDDEAAREADSGAEQLGGLVPSLPALRETPRASGFGL
jgi:hypothetical protein